MRAALAEHTTTATSALPDALVRRLVSDQRDDVAVLALRVRHTVARPPGPGRPSVLTRQVEHGSSAIGPARRWVDDVLESCDVSPSVRRIAMLLTSEVLTNAVQHGAAPVEAELEVGHRVLRVAVRDGSATLPRLRSPRPDETGGRGVQFLERCASRWGVDALDGAPGKTVWFELDLGD